MLSLKELSNKYNLSHDVVRAEIEKTISSILTRRFRFDVDVFLEDTLEIYGYPADSIICIDKRSIKKRLIREIKYNIVKNLSINSAYRDYNNLKPIISSIVYGEIIKTSDRKDVYVSLEDKDVVAVCKFANQTPKERGLYKVGARMCFYVTRVDVFLKANAPQIVVSLSRNSKGLPEKLLEQSLSARGITNVDVCCEKRIAGAISIIKTSQKIPRDCIKEVADELKERIKVHYNDP